MTNSGFLFAGTRAEPGPSATVLSAMATSPVSIKAVALLGSLSLFWGLNWPGMKIILAEMPVWWFRALCLIAGGVILMALSALSGNRCRPARAEIGPVLVCSIFAILGWMVFSAYGVSLMPAGRASIIAFTMPLWATLVAAVVLNEKFTLNKAMGLVFGLSGLAFLIGPDLVILQRAPVGAIFMLLAAVSWATGTILFKRFDWRLPILSNVAWQLLFCAVPVTLVAALTETLPDLRGLSLEATIALVYLFLFPMSFCQWAYFKTVSMLPASVASIGTLMVPVIGVYSSHLILDETVGLNEILALLLVVSALLLVLVIPAWKHSRAGAALNP